MGAEQIRAEFTELTWDIFWKTAMLGVSAEEISKSSGRSIAPSMSLASRTLSIEGESREVSNHWEPTQEP